MFSTLSTHTSDSLHPLRGSDWNSLWRYVVISSVGISLGWTVLGWGSSAVGFAQKQLLLFRKYKSGITSLKTVVLESLASLPAPLCHVRFNQSGRKTEVLTFLPGSVAPGVMPLGLPSLSWGLLEPTLCSDTPGLSQPHLTPFLPALPGSFPDSHHRSGQEASRQWLKMDQVITYSVVISTELPKKSPSSSPSQSKGPARLMTDSQPRKAESENMRVSRSMSSGPEGRNRPHPPSLSTG